jgi:hypothetical protein
MRPAAAAAGAKDDDKKEEKKRPCVSCVLEPTYRPRRFVTGNAAAHTDPGTKCYGCNGWSDLERYEYQNFMKALQTRLGGRFDANWTLGGPIQWHNHFQDFYTPPHTHGYPLHPYLNADGSWSRVASDWHSDKRELPVRSCPHECTMQFPSVARRPAGNELGACATPPSRRLPCARTE